MEFQELLDGVAERLGLPGRLVPDENREVVVRIAEDIELTFREYPEYAGFLVKGFVCDLPKAGGDPFTAEMMRANFICRGTCGGTLSLDDDNRVQVHIFLGFSFVTVDFLVKGLGNFSDMIRNWRDLAKEYEKVFAENAEPEEPPSNERIWLGMSGFLVV